MTAPPVTDHRTRTGANRREKMRRRLIETALVIIAERGVLGMGVEDVIRAAGVSRGTFYNYFSSGPELARAVGSELKGEVLGALLAQIGTLPDPATRLAGALAALQASTVKYPLLARFIRNLNLGGESDVLGLAEGFPQLLAAGIAAGQFTELPIETLNDIVLGTVFKMVARTIEGGADPTYLRHTIAAILRALGVDAAEAWRIADISSPPMALRRDGLLWRVHQHHTATAAADATNTER